ncbi:Inner membrane protein yhaH [Phocoenobacter uteri]|uniref:Inner membrane protein yhaH n=1 Tax=Phocoenobacter uteri TaxID=146806 RepID=A0A379CCI4_9PAST|nr:DUF805 domain-containing protein [Phocoenobacter uteri]MDG6881427.1 hypothetical protein [Phocoenobacter uteri]SUB59456.1 Inner membrane protein yhaH [Phocoenobacter uteri]
MNWYLEVLKKYAVFNGRARRKEYWFFILFSTVVSFILSILDNLIGFIDYNSGLGILGGIYSLAILIPSIAVSVRRLHDINRSGWWMLITFIPVIGLIVLFVFACLKGTEGENKYGDDPLEQENSVTSF